MRVKVSSGPKVLPSETASVAVHPSVRLDEGEMTAADLSVLARWIELNKDVLIDYWEGEIDTKDALDAIRPLPE